MTSPDPGHDVRCRMTATRTHPSVLHIHDRGPAVRHSSLPGARRACVAGDQPDPVCASRGSRFVEPAWPNRDLGRPARAVRLASARSTELHLDFSPNLRNHPRRASPSDPPSTNYSHRDGTWAVVRDRAWRGSWVPSQGGSRSIVKPQGSIPSDDGVLGVNWSQAFRIS